MKAYLGITEKEKNRKQKISVSVIMVPIKVHHGDEDTIESTINYSSVRDDVIRIASDRKYSLIETVAETIADRIISDYPLRQVTVIVKKFPYRDTDFVSCEITLGNEK